MGQLTPSFFPAAETLAPLAPLATCSRFETFETFESLANVCGVQQLKGAMAASLCSPFDLGLVLHHVGSHGSALDHSGVLPHELQRPRVALGERICKFESQFQVIGRSQALSLLFLACPRCWRALPHARQCLATQDSAWIGSHVPYSDRTQHS